jgi:hypothetical protein
MAGLGILGALGFVDHLIFRKFTHTSYLRWYIANGSVISLITSLLSLAWGDLNKRLPELISSNPMEYFGCCSHLLAVPVEELSVHARNHTGGLGEPSRFDMVLATSVLVCVMLIAILWLLFVVPLQYVAFLICGAPSRVMAKSRFKAVYTFYRYRLLMDHYEVDKPVASGWWESQLRTKPLTLTGLFSAALLALLRFIVL